VPGRPTARTVERETLPFTPSAAGCAYSMHVRAGQWGRCGGRPAVTGVWTCPRTRKGWRAFACAAHADRLDGPECRDVGPLDDAAVAELADPHRRGHAVHPAEPILGGVPPRRHPAPGPDGGRLPPRSAARADT
jgi:hypothetical protein